MAEKGPRSQSTPCAGPLLGKRGRIRTGHAAAGHPTDALTIAADIGDRHQQSRAHTGLGYAHHSLANPDRAREHYEHALTLYTDLGMPDADQIRTHLTTIDNQSDRA